MAGRQAPKRSTPRQGTTTITTGGLHRKTVYFSDEEWEAIRRHAFEKDRAYTDIIREAVRRLLGVKAASNRGA